MNMGSCWTRYFPPCPLFFSSRGFRQLSTYSDNISLLERDDSVRSQSNIAILFQGKVKLFRKRKSEVYDNWSLSRETGFRQVHSDEINGEIINATVLAKHLHQTSPPSSLELEWEHDDLLPPASPVWSECEVAEVQESGGSSPGSIQNCPTPTSDSMEWDNNGHSEFVT